MVSLVNWETLAARYVQELHEEGVSVYEPISAAAVVADLARLAGVPTPAVVAEHDHIHDFDFTAPVELFGECTVCGSLPF